MKRYLFLLLSALLLASTLVPAQDVVRRPIIVPAGGGAPIAFVQADNVSVSAASSITSGSLTFTAGNIIVVGLLMGNTTATASISNSNGGNTWATALGPADFSTVRRSYQFYAVNCVGGTYTITATRSSGTSNMGLVVAEYSGIATSSPLDQTSSGGTTSTSLSVTPDVTTTQADEVLVGTGGAITNTLTYTAGTDYTLRHADTGIRMALEDRIVSATGTYDSPMTISASTAWGMILGTYKKAP